MKKKLYIITFFPFLLSGFGLMSIVGKFAEMPIAYEIAAGLALGLIFWIVETDMLYKVFSQNEQEL